MHAIDFGIKELPDYLKLTDEQILSVTPAEITGISRILSAKGKRLRPSIVIAVAYYNGHKIDEQVIRAAAAVELVHIASLVHDDIMDGGTVRHGVPTINAQEGDDLALLAGDHLLAKANKLAASVSAEAGIILADTIADLCIGQAVEISDRFNLDRSPESLLKAIKGKTSALFMAACALGGKVADSGTVQLVLLADFAENYGIAYQLLDDVSDFTGTAALSGKTAVSDIGEGNYTLPVILSLNAFRGDKLRKILESKSATEEEILEILNSDGSISRCEQTAGEYKKKAATALKKIENQELAQALNQLLM